MQQAPVVMLDGRLSLARSRRSTRCPASLTAPACSFPAIFGSLCYVSVAGRCGSSSSRGMSGGSAVGEFAQSRDQDQVAVVLRLVQGGRRGRAARRVAAAAGEELGVCPPGLVAGERGSAREGGLDVRRGLVRPSLAGQEGTEPGRCPGAEQRGAPSGMQRLAVGGFGAAGQPGRLAGDAQAAVRGSSPFRVPDADGDAGCLLRRFDSLAALAEGGQGFGAAPQALGFDGRVAGRAGPAEGLLDLRQSFPGLAGEGEGVAAGGARAPQPQYLARDDRQVGEAAELTGGLAKPALDEAAHRPAVQQARTAAAVAGPVQQPGRPAHAVPGAGQVGLGQVDDGGRGQGLAEGRRLVAGFGDRQLGEFAAAGRADGPCVQDGQLSEDAGSAGGIVEAAQRGGEVGAGGGELAAAPAGLVERRSGFRCEGALAALGMLMLGLPGAWVVTVRWRRHRADGAVYAGAEGEHSGADLRR